MPTRRPILSKSHGPMFALDITSITGEKAAYSVHRSSSRASGVVAVASYPPRLAVHSGIPAQPRAQPRRHHRWQTVFQRETRLCPRPTETRSHSHPPLHCAQTAPHSLSVPSESAPPSRCCTAPHSGSSSAAGQSHRQTSHRPKSSLRVVILESIRSSRYRLSDLILPPDLRLRIGEVDQ